MVLACLWEVEAASFADGLGMRAKVERGWRGDPQVWGPDS